MAILAGIGLWLYVITYNKFSKNYTLSLDQTIGFVKLVILTFLAIFIYAYVSHYTPQIGSGYFVGVGHGQVGGFLNILGLTYSLISLMVLAEWIISYDESWNKSKKLLSFLSSISLFFVISTRTSRTVLISTLLLCILIVQMKYHFSTKRLLFIIIIAALFAYSFGSALKLYNVTTYSSTSRIENIINVAVDSDITFATLKNFKIDVGYRLNGLEWASAIYYEQNTNNVSYMYGEHLFQSFLSIFPRQALQFLPFERKDPEGVVDSHYNLLLSDENASPIGSMIADFGIYGIFLIFPILGFVHSRFILPLCKHKFLRSSYLGLSLLFLTPDVYAGTTIFLYWKLFGFLFMIRCLVEIPSLINRMFR